MFGAIASICYFCRSIFEKYQSLVVLSLYVLGIVVALIVSTLLNKFILKSENSVFIVEPYI